MEAATLFRWSTLVQLSSLLMIAAFFVALMRSMPDAKLRWWISGWACNAVALCISVSYWLWQPETVNVQRVLRAVYMGGKTAFVVLLVVGAWQLRDRGRAPRLRTLVIAIGSYAVVGSFLVRGITTLGIVQQGVVGIGFGIGVWILARPSVEAGVGWLLTGFLVRCVLSFVESASYAVALLPEGTLGAAFASQVAIFSSSHSVFDSGTEWLIAFGCVLALNERTQNELRNYNQSLLAAQAELRQVADHDPLTGLQNRRALRSTLRAVRPGGATILFFDLDRFKAINDELGHKIGDHCLKRFADALRECFRPDDTVMRYAGDEFLVIASGLEPEAVERRVARFRDTLEVRSGELPPIEFSVGIAELVGGGDPFDALEAADQSMYRAKASR